MWLSESEADREWDRICDEEALQEYLDENGLTLEEYQEQLEDARFEYQLSLQEDFDDYDAWGMR